MIVTAHQPNLLPGLSVVEKVRASDAVIWLDTVQYTHGGWSNRNRMPDGSWLTVPVDRATDMGAFNRVRVSDHGPWRRKASKTLAQHYGRVADEVCAEMQRPYGLLIGLNLACLRIILDHAEIATPAHFQSHLDGGNATVAVSNNRETLRPISERLAMMVAELGGTTYLSGPSGFRYLDEAPFRTRGLTVEYFTWARDNPCSLELLRTKRGDTLPTTEEAA
jgi:hypothetical protein